VSVWILPVLVSGCGMQVSDVSLKPPLPRTSTIRARTTWVLPVEIRDPDTKDSGVIEDALTRVFLHYVTQGRYFSTTKAFAGELAPGDLVIKLRFDRYQIRRSVHPLNIPMGLVTLGIYYVAAGPISIETVDLRGELTVRDASGAVLATATGSVKKSTSSSMYTAPEHMAGGARDLTDFVAMLLEDVSGQLRDATACRLSSVGVSTARRRARAVNTK
jgi:hypothetical protein